MSKMSSPKTVLHEALPGRFFGHIAGKASSCLAISDKFYHIPNLGASYFWMVFLNSH
jgi:hypothetical protein